MVFPDNLAVELLYDGVWNDETDYFYTRNPISITRGRSSEAAQVQVSRCGMVVDNRDGRFSPRNPLSPLFGKIGRNTPIRVLGPVTPTDVILADEFDRTEASGWGTADSGQTWTTTVNFGSPTASVAPGFGLHDLDNSLDSDIQSSASLDTTFFDLSVSVSMASVPSSMDTWALLRGRSSTTLLGTLGLRAERTGGGAITLTLELRDGVTEIATADVSHLSLATPIRLRFVSLPFELRGKAWQEGSAEPEGWDLYEGVDALGDGDNLLVRTLAISTDVTWRYSDLTVSAINAPNDLIRFSGEVPAWPQQWDKPGKDVWVPVDAAGILRRLGQGKSVPTNGLRSTILADQSVMYWPLDDAVGTAEGVNLGAASYASGNSYRFKTGSGVVREYGTGDLGSLGAGLEITDTVPGFVYGSHSINKAATAVAVDYVWRCETLGDFDLYAQGFEDDGETDTWRVELRDSGDVRVYRIVETPSTSSENVLDTSSVLPELSDGQTHHVRLTLTEDGSDVDWAVFVDGVSVVSGTVTTAAVDGLAVTRFVYDAGVSGTPITLGHVVSWATGIPSVTDLAFAATGYDGETAGRRIERLCAESGIEFQGVGDLDDTVTLGPQTEGDLLAALRMAAVSDGGVLYEPREFLGLAYRTRTDLYNQAAALELDYDDNVFGALPEPVDDDQQTRNDVTVTRQSGGSANAVLESGALSVLDPPDGVGRYDADVRVSLGSEFDLPNHASWRLHLGTVDQPRYPSLVLPLHVAAFTTDAALTAAVLGLDLGDRVTVDNLPTWVTHDLADVLAQGFTETLDPDSGMWTVEVNTSPYSPFQVAEYESGEGGTYRYDTAGSRIAEDFDAGTDTSMTVETTVLPKWTTDDDEFPFDIECGGVRLTVTDIAAGAGELQTFTITQAPVNGIIKTIPEGTAVSLWFKARYAL
jgi:hypothetical protein